MSADYKFQGWLGHDPSAADGNMKWEAYEPKKWEESDIDIKITHCGICGSDLHTLRSGWKPTIYPCCVGWALMCYSMKTVKLTQRSDTKSSGMPSGSVVKPKATSSVIPYTASFLSCQKNS